jgi:antirestriction protein ArdC
MQAKVEELHRQLERAFELLAEEVTRGDTSRLQAYLMASTRFHSYSFGNQWLIWLSRPDATRVAGFRTWLGMGRAVNKGEKGIAILAPRTYTRTETNKQGQEVEKTGLYFAIATVFDISQTSVVDAERWEAVEQQQFFCPLGNDCDDLLARMIAAATAEGLRVEEQASLGINDSTQGYSAHGTIALLAGADSRNKVVVLAHEWTHERLHWSPDGQRLNRSVMEGEAEVTAWLVARHFGIDDPFAAAYLVHWGNTAASLRESLERVRDTAAHIIGAIEQLPVVGAESDAA